MNVYFWLFLGLLLKLPTIDASDLPIAVDVNGRD
jgi:hypothetical protein